MPGSDNARLIDRIEQASRIASAIAIPILVAIFGSLIQRQLATENLSRDYVQLAVTILKEPKRDGDEELRAWAVKLLNAHSTIKLDEKVSTQLRNGDISLPQKQAANFSAWESSTAPIANEWLKLIDSGDYDRAVKDLFWPVSTSESSVLAIISKERNPLGKVIFRKAESVADVMIPGFPFATKFSYETQFSNNHTYRETIIVGMTPYGLRIVSHLINPIETKK